MPRRCNGKSAYGSAVGAMMAIEQMHSSLQTKLEYYRCSECHFYHIGHTTTYRARRAKRKLQQEAERLKQEEQRAASPVQLKVGFWEAAKKSS
jgi:hypothetical protein